MWVSGAQSAGLNLSGAVSYSERYTVFSGGDAVQGNTLTGSLAMHSYIWQPWFITWGLNAGVSKTETRREDDTTSGIVYTGDASVTVFGRSRFPFNATYGVSDSSVETVVWGYRERELPDNETVLVYSPFDDQTDSMSRRLQLRQTYTTLGGTYYSLWRNSAAWWTRDDARQTTTTLGGGVSKRWIHQSLQLNAYNVQSNGDAGNTESSLFSLNHLYSPNPEFNVDTYFSGDESSSGLDAQKRENLNASSSFFWRPEYSDYSVNGSVKASERGAEGAKSRSLSGFIGSSYRYSRLVRLTGSISASLSENDGGTDSASTSQSVGATYSSDRYYWGKASWGWNSGLSLANTASKSGGVTDNSQTITGSVGHNLSKSFEHTRRLRSSITGSQSFALSKQSDGDIGKSLGNSVRANLSHRGQQANTSAWASLSDNRDLNGGSNQQVFQTQLSRDQRVSTVSSLAGTMSFSWNRQAADGEETISRSAGGGMTYNNSRLFGVYRLTFSSRLRLEQASAFEGNTRLVSSLENRAAYALGLLSASFIANFVEQRSGSGVTQTYVFMVTRSF